MIDESKARRVYFRFPDKKKWGQSIREPVWGNIASVVSFSYGAGYIAPNWVPDALTPFFTPEIESRYAGLLIHLLFINIAFLAELR